MKSRVKIPLSKSIIGERIFLAGLILLVASLPFSKFALSISQFVLAAGWLFSSRIWSRVGLFFRTPSAWMLSGMYLLFVLGMLYSTDLSHGFKEIRIKLPLLILPFLISTAPPLSRRQWNLVMGTFITAVVVSSFISTYILITRDIIDPRQITPYVSHIRFGLMLSLCFFACLFYAYKTLLWSMRLAMILLSAWILVFLVLLESATGVAITLILGAGMLVYMVFHKGRFWVRMGFLAGLAAFILIAVLFVRNVVYEEIIPPEKNLSALEKYTERGNPYFHDTLSTWHENGHYIFLYICEPELKKEWNKRSSLPYDGLDKQGHQLKYTLIRFLNSKGWRKDGEAVAKLTDDEVGAIEKGVANINYLRRSFFRARLSQIIYEYKNYQQRGDPSGHSMLQRLEYWKAAIGIIRDNPWLGVGTGDINQAFTDQYDKTGSPLDLEFRLRAHNQYLRIGGSLGIIGLTLFILFLLYPIFAARAWEEMLFMPFIIIVILSMITEDTLETQVGATFFAFFYAFLLWGRRNIFSKRKG